MSDTTTVIIGSSRADCRHVFENCYRRLHDDHQDVLDVDNISKIVYSRNYSHFTYRFYTYDSIRSGGGQGARPDAVITTGGCPDDRQSIHSEYWATAAASTSAYVPFLHVEVRDGV